MLINEVDNPLSYRSIQNSIKDFRSIHRNKFNLYDEPGTFWFRPIFYFYKSDASTEDIDINNEGLLHPSWLERGDEYSTRWEKYFATSAYNYLCVNDERYRAALLKQFITLLSNIVTNSPWYFQEVSGLDNALDFSERFKTGHFIADDRKQITFTLLPDAIDTRIGTLLDLYRTVCYSWKDKREILPSNLRKFDMGLYIFNSMIQNEYSNLLSSSLNLSGALTAADKLGIGYNSKQQIVDAAGNYDYDITNKPTGQPHIYIEFINCEIDLSSSKGGDSISNAEGSERKYTLTINYDDCYVNRYNDFIIGAIGDILSVSSEDMTALYNNGLGIIMGDSRNGTVGRRVLSDGLLSKAARGALEQAASMALTAAKGLIESTVGKTVLGSLYGFSFLNSAAQLSSGRLDVVNQEYQKAISPVDRREAGGPKETLYEDTPREIENNIEGSLYSNKPNKVEKDISGNLYEDKPEKVEENLDENLYEDKPFKNPKVTELGNIYRNMSMTKNL